MIRQCLGISTARGIIRPTGDQIATATTMMTGSDDNNGDSDNAGAGVSDDGDGWVVRRSDKLSAGALLTSAAATLLWCAMFAAFVPQPRVVAGAQLYTNTFSVRLHGDVRDGNGHVDEAVAHRVAKRAGSGFENIGKVYRMLYTEVYMRSNNNALITLSRRYKI
jgi:hypothetical protein